MKDKNLTYAEICLKNKQFIKDADYKIDKKGNVKTAVILGGVRRKPKK